MQLLLFVQTATRATRQLQNFRVAELVAAPASQRPTCRTGGGPLVRAAGASLALSVPLFHPEADEERPDCQHRAEHAEDDARPHQVGASESVHE